MNFVMGTMFLVLPTLWMGALSWTGVKIGGVVDGALNTGTQDSKAAGSKFGGTIPGNVGGK